MPSCDLPAVTDDGDAETVRLLRRADGTGLRRLLRVHGGRVRARLLRVFGGCLGEDEIDEAMNTATFRAWRRAEQFDPEKGTLRAWFYVIASNACREQLRARKRRGWVTQGADIDRMEPAVVIPSAPPAYLDVLQECIRLLPARQRHIIEADLRNGDVADADELAAALSTTRNTVYVARCEARKSLRRALRARGYAPDSEGEEEKQP